ncbi:MAG: hypothetical protein M3479_10815 [Actinomycetota bacterium]|nr:hypothetical protein [Actinomycetota bacterium]
MSDPRSKAKSVALTDEGKRRGREAFRRRFASAPWGPSAPAAQKPRILE